PYAPGYSPATVDHYRSRTVARHAAFFLPYVTTGMTLLDCGCGPGSLTVGLALAVGSGMVVGIDCEPGVIARAKALGQAYGVPNVAFHVADVCALPFAAGRLCPARQHNPGGPRGDH